MVVWGVTHAPIDRYLVVIDYLLDFPNLENPAYVISITRLLHHVGFRTIYFEGLIGIPESPLFRNPLRRPVCFLSVATVRKLSADRKRELLRTSAVARGLN